MKTINVDESGFADLWIARDDAVVAEPARVQVLFRRDGTATTLLEFGSNPQGVHVGTSEADAVAYQRKRAADDVREREMELERAREILAAFDGAGS